MSRVTDHVAIHKMLNAPCHRPDHGNIAQVPIIINMMLITKMTVSPCIAPVRPSLTIISADPVQMIARQYSRKLVVKVSISSAHPTTTSNCRLAMSGDTGKWVTNLRSANLTAEDTMIRISAHRTDRIGRLSISTVSGVVIGVVTSDCFLDHAHGFADADSDFATRPR